MSRHAPYKDLQLCAQVRDALYWVLGSTVGDDRLGLLQVMAVEPMPDASRLLVTLVVPPDMSIEAALRYLHDASKAIRSEVAASIHRRKAPELTFQVIPG